MPPRTHATNAPIQPRKENSHATETPLRDRAQKQEKEKGRRDNFNLVAVTVVLMNRTASWVVDEPRGNARPVEATEALESRHLYTGYELFQTNGTLC